MFCFSFQWTTHEDIKSALKAVGVSPLEILDIKIFECRANGQSKGFCLVSLSSESSLQLVNEQLEKKTTIHGRTPVIKPDVKSSAIYFDSLSKTRPPPATSQNLNSSSGSNGGQNQSQDRPRSSSSNNGSSAPNNGRMRLGGPYSRFGSSNNNNRGNGLMGNAPLLRHLPPPPISWAHFGQNHQNNRFNPSRFYRGPPTHPPPLLPYQGHGIDDWRSIPPPIPPFLHPRVHLNPAFLNRMPSNGCPPMFLPQNEGMDWNNHYSSSGMMDENNNNQFYSNGGFYNGKVK